LKISIRLILGFFIVALLIGVVGIVPYDSVSNLDEVREFLELMSVPALITLEKISTNFEIMHSSVHEMDNNAEEAKKTYNQAKDETITLIDVYDSLTQIKGKNKEYLAWKQMRDMMQNFASQMKAQLEEFDDMSQELSVLYETKASKDEIMKKHQELHSEYENFKGVVEEDKKMELAGLERESQKVINEEKRVLKVILTISIMGIIVAMVLGFFIYRSLSKPLYKLTKGAEIIGKGNLKYKIDIKSKDEIGDLANAFNKMTEDLITSQKRLQDQAQNLEKAIKERTKELEQSKKELEKSGWEKDKQRTATLSILEDVGETKKELEKSYGKLKELDKVKSQFLNITSHELRTPVTPIKMQIGLLLEGYFGKITDKQKESLNMIFRNTERLDSLIADILDISKIQSGGLKFDLEKTDLAYCIKESMESVKPLANGKNITLTAKIAKLPKLTLDKNRIIQVLTNLINNATKFTPENGKIMVEAEMQKDNILVKVTDTGTGIAEKDLKRIFEPFFQVKPSYKIKSKGTGLGLSICRGVIERHGGKIWVKSELGKGSTFYITLPINVE